MTVLLWVTGLLLSLAPTDESVTTVATPVTQQELHRVQCGLHCVQCGIPGQNMFSV
jgi:hypothetical protein